MYLTGITQRDRLFRLATRWFADQPEPHDGAFVTQVFVFENVIAAPTIRAFVMDVQRAARPGPVRLSRLQTKDQLRRAIVTGCTPPCGVPSAREYALFELFRRDPEEFFPHTPTDLVLATRPDGRLLGMIRVKRVRRIADKTSRRIADALAGNIRDLARELARHRAESAGLPLDRLDSTPEQMAADFSNAERAISHAFQDGRLSFRPQDLRVDDVVGIKFIGDPDDLAAIEHAIRHHPAVLGVEREEHRGAYNDVNLVVDLQLPPADAIIDGAGGQDWSFAADRGLAPDALARAFPGYVESGARSFRTEVILCTREELVESEFGRSIHEQRIIEQRTAQSYSGRIAGNAGFLVEYLLMLAVSPTTRIDDLPIKMWGRYLPDVYALSVWKLFGIRLGLDLVDAFTAEPGARAEPALPD